jgi:hypothetical protein
MYEKLNPLFIISNRIYMNTIRFNDIPGKTPPDCCQPPGRS